MAPYPEWLHVLAWAYLSLSLLCAVWILIHEMLHRTQKMAVMYLVWPITALYDGPAAAWFYLRMQEPRSDASDEPSPGQVALSVTHCGAGCTLGDIAGETAAFAAGLTFAGGIFPTRMVLDLALAWLFGIIFQYFSIVPMRGLSPGEGIAAAIRADTLSILAFEVGMFAWMALTYYVIFPGPHLDPGEAVFWFLMQIAMCVGFLTSYPANVFLLKAGWKEKMN